MALAERLNIHSFGRTDFAHRAITRLVKGYITGETAADVLNGEPYPASGTAAEVYRRMSQNGEGFYSAVTEVSNDFRMRHNRQIPSTRLSRAANVAAFAVYGTADLLTKHLLRSKVGPAVKPVARTVHRAARSKVGDPRPPVEGGWGSEGDHRI